jgi:hypothetical protein
MVEIAVARRCNVRIEAIGRQERMATAVTPRKSVIHGEVRGGDDWKAGLTIGGLAPLFLEWARYEMRRSPWTIIRYRDALRWVIRDIGDLPVAALHRGHLLRLRQRMEQRGCQEARVTWTCPGFVDTAVKGL